MLKQFRPKKLFLLTTLWLFLLLVVFASFAGIFNSSNRHRVEAATSSTINFQARLLSSSGSLVPDGYYNVQFNLYSVSSGGTSQWTETYYDSNGVTAGNDNRVRVVNGYLSVYLGSQNPFPGTINWDQQQWITINIGGTTQTATPTWDGEMSPRLQLTAVPYAFRAAQLAKLTGANTSTLDFATQTGARSILLPDESGTLCIQGSSSCGFATGTSASYIQNGTSTQTNANFNIQSAASGSVGGIIQGASGQTADLLQFKNSGGTILTAFDASGKLVFGPSGSQDTNLYRSTNDTLKTDDSLIVGTNLSVTGTSTLTGNVGIGTSPGSFEGLVVAKTYGSATAAESYSQRITTTYSIADTGTKQGLRLNTNATNTSGTQASLVGLLALNSSNGNGGTTTDSTALWTRNDAATGATIQSAYGLKVVDGTGAGTINNQYGVYINSLTKGGTSNYAIYTNGSTQSFFGGNIDTGGDINIQGGDLTTNQTTFNLLAGATTALNIGPGSTTAVSINLAGGAGATGCTVAGATGNLTCDGAIATNATTGTQGWWTRSGTTLSPVNSGDAITTSGNISTSGSGTITAAGTLTANGQSVVIQPSSSLTAGQTNISQTLTNASSSGGTVIGYNQSFTISNTASSSTNNGINLTLTDNASSLGNLNTGLNVTLNGSNSTQGDVGISSSVVRGLAIQGITSGSTGTSSGAKCNNISSLGVGVCAGDSASSNSGGGLYAYTSSRGTTNIYDPQGSGVYGINQAGGTAGAFYTGVKGITTTNSAAAYTTTGVFGQAKGGAGASAYGGYFTLDSTSGATLGSALYASNSSIAANILQLQDNTTDVFTVADGGNVTAAADIAINGGDLTTTATTFNLLAGATTALNIGPASTTAVSINLAGGSSDTGCTVAGATGNLTCSGAIATTATTGTQGWWTRSGTTLSPVNAGDAITTTGNISTSGSGTITAAGILNANATGKTAIQIADSGAQSSGITIGGDTNLYRGAADTLQTDDSLVVRRGSLNAFQVQNAAGTNTVFNVDTLNALIAVQDANGATGNSSISFNNRAIFGYEGTNQNAYIQGASGKGIEFQTNGSTTNVATLSTTGQALFQNSTNSTTAFQIQNALGTSTLFNVDTTTSNLITNPSFEVDTSGWATTGSGTGLAISRNTTAANVYHGIGSLQIVTASSAANTGATVTSFTSSITPGTYTLNFIARATVSFSTFNVTITGGSAPTCLTGQTVGTGFQSYSCTFTSTSTNVTAINFITTTSTQRTIYLDAVQLITGSTSAPYNIGKLQLNGVVTSPTVFQNLSDSNSALQVVTSDGSTKILTVDTLHGEVGIGAPTTGNDELYVQSNSDVTIHGKNTGSANLLVLDNNSANILTLNNAGQLQLATQGSTGGLQIGSDTLLYRSSANTLSLGSNDSLAIPGGDLSVDGGDLTTAATTFNLLSTNATTINFGDAATTALNIGPGGATAATINIAGGSGATGCTVAGATGNLTCSGAIATTATTGTQGWWTRSGTTLSPVNSGDNIATTGQLQLSTTGSSAGILVGGDAQIYRTAADMFGLGNGDSLRTYSSGGSQFFTIQSAATSVYLDARNSGASDWVLVNKVTTDSQQRYILKTSGEMQWGGGSSAPDVILTRSGAGSLNLQSTSGNNSATAFTIQNGSNNTLLAFDNSLASGRLVIGGTGTSSEKLELYRANTTTANHLYLTTTSGNDWSIGQDTSTNDISFWNDDLHANVLTLTTKGHLYAKGSGTGTTKTTEATARTSVTTVTITSAGFANNDVIRLVRSGTYYYTRIVSGGGTTTLTVSPAVSYDASSTVEKYNVQYLGNDGATFTGTTRSDNSYFQGYFTGGVVTGTGSTIYSDANISSTNDLKIQAASSVNVQNSSDSATAFHIQNAAGTDILNVDTSNKAITITGSTSGSNAQTFNYTGGTQTFTVPAGVTSINVTLYGAGGGSGGQGNTASTGGQTTGTLAVTPGQVLTIYVGGAGGNGTAAGVGGAGGYNGGGAGGNAYNSSYPGGGGGGGASMIKDGATLKAAAGGGGGGAGYGTGSTAAGGNGGGTSGNAGNSSRPGGGGTQSAGGTGYGSGSSSFCGTPATSGSSGQGGAGGVGTGGAVGASGSGGGGGGYYGGGGGDCGTATGNGGGGGGSGYSALLTGASMTTGGNSGNGQVSITWTSQALLVQDTSNNTYFSVDSTDSQVGTFANTALFRNTSDNTTAFQIQNASSTSLFTADTANSQIIVRATSTVSGGGANGGTGSGTTGDAGGGAGGAIGTVNAPNHSGGTGATGAQSADVSGLFSVLSAVGGYPTTSPGSGNSNSGTYCVPQNGGNATGFGTGGGGANYYGGNGGNGLYGGGGGGASGGTGCPSYSGGTGGAGVVVISFSDGTNVVQTSGSSYTVPSGATSAKVWAIGAGGGGAGSPTGDGFSGGGGGAGSVVYRTFAVVAGQSITYSRGTGGTGGTGAANGNAGGSTTATYGSITITAGGGSGGQYNNNSTGAGGTYSGQSTVLPLDVQNSSGTTLLNVDSTNSTVNSTSISISGPSLTGGAPLTIRNSGAASGKYWNVGPETGNNFHIYNQSGTGQWMGDGATTWTANSDERLKTNIASIDDSDALTKLLQLNPVTYNWKDVNNNPDVTHLGFLAQDVQQLFPNLVSMGGNITMHLADGSTETVQNALGVDYTSLIVPTIAAIKQLNNNLGQIQTLQGEHTTAIDQLETSINEINAKVDVIGSQLVISSDANLQGSLTVSGNSTLQGNLNAGQDFSVAGKTGLSSDLSVNGTTRLKSSLRVDGTAQLQQTTASSLDIIGAVTADSLTANVANVNQVYSTNAAITDLSVNGTATIATLHVTGDSILDGNLTINAHIITGLLDQNAQLATEVTDAAGTDINGNQNATCNIDGNDTSGSIVLITGSQDTSDGAVCKATFIEQFGTAPRSIIGPTDKDSAQLGAYVTSDTDSFTLNFINAPEANHTYRFNYWNPQ